MPRQGQTISVGDGKGPQISSAPVSHPLTCSFVEIIVSSENPSQKFAAAIPAFPMVTGFIFCHSAGNIFRYPFCIKRSSKRATIPTSSAVALCSYRDICRHNQSHPLPSVQNGSLIFPAQGIPGEVPFLQ